RRRVDFARRRTILESLEARLGTVEGRQAVPTELLNSRADGQIKLYVIYSLLQYRRAHPGLFTVGRYVPLEMSGPRQDHACCFLRMMADAACITVVPRLVGGMVGFSGQVPLGAQVWQDTRLIIPTALGGIRFMNLLTGEDLQVVGDSL